VTPAVKLRPYAAADEEAAIELWRRSWQQSFPAIDFSARLDWWGRRWREDLVPTAAIVVAESAGTLAGFVTVDRQTGYLDQIVVAPEAWGHGIAAALIAEAKRLSPAGLDLLVNTDNARAIRFYDKQGFVTAGTATNPISGRPVYRLTWRP
jgi:putative acetyltransferase